MTDMWSEEAVRKRMAGEKRAYLIRLHSTEAAAFQQAADRATEADRGHLLRVAARHQRLADMARHGSTYPDDLEDWTP